MTASEPAVLDAMALGGRVLSLGEGGYAIDYSFGVPLPQL